MNEVQPIRDPEIIQAIKDDLLKKNERNYILFVLGINTGLRISDMLLLRIRDVRKPCIVIQEKKTNKSQEIEITPDLKRALKSYIQNKKDNQYLFPSRQGVNKPIGRSMAYKIIHAAVTKYGLENIGCHTTRKTFGYHFYLQSDKDIDTLQDIFNHSTRKMTLRYIGISRDTKNSAIRKLKI